MKEWFTTAELAEAKLPDLPRSRQGVEAALAHGRGTDKARQRPGRGGGFEYHASLLPPSARAKLAFVQAAPVERASNGHSRLLWQRFEGLSNKDKDVCRARLAVLTEVDAMVKSGISKKEALAYCLPKADIGRATYFEWRKMVEGHARADWLAALAPSFAFAGSGIVPEVIACHPDAWDAFKSDYLRPEAPGFSACYRRMEKASKRKGWAPVPSERTLRRHLDAEVPKAAQLLARSGEKAAADLYPSQTRSKDHLHAMQIGNTDGHELDLFVDVPWSPDLPVRMTLLGIQDIYSGKILSHVICEQETWDAVRASIGAMIENEGGKLLDHLYMDNGRAFASKKISGGAKSRHRFKIDEDEVAGLLVTLGIEPHFVKPYSGRSKPIERAWGDLAEEISKHPAMAGAYTGRNTQEKPENYRSRAVPLALLQETAASVIADHNARTGRKSPVARGRSFNQVFEESVRHPSTVIRYATEEQRSLWLLTAETVKARKPSGAIHYMGNIYWAPALNEWIGKVLAIRFDPHKLHEPVKVYDPAGRFICDAPCHEAVGFNDVSKARQHEKNRKTLVKHNRAIADMHRKLTAEELADLYAAQAEKKPAPVRPVVTRLVTGNLAHAEPVDLMSDDDFEESFSRGLALMSGDVIQFPQGKIPARKAGRGRAGE